MGIEVVVADLADGLPDGDLVRRAGAVPRRVRPDPRPARGDRGRPTSGAALAVVAADLLALTLLESPGHARRRRRGRLLPALRRAAVLRRSARRLHGGARRAGAAPARSAGRRLGRLGRAPGLPALAADPRAAHPPRPGDLQHLHRAGAAGRGRRRCTPSTTVPTGCRGSRAATHRHAHGLAARAARRGRRGRARRSSSTPCSPGSPGARPRWSMRARDAGVHLRLVDDDHVGREHVGDHRRRRWSTRCWARSGVEADRDDVDRRATSDACRPRCVVRRTS